jgi:tripartite-type tricarboxylate transporter receptor subunit TctC
MKTLSTLEQEARKRAGPRYSWPFGVALLVLGVSLLLFGLPATAQPQLTGRTVTILVGYTAGGGYDRFARIVARHLPRYLPGTPAVVVQNMPGAESVVAANHLFNAARPDGLTIGLFNRNLVFAQLVGVAGVRFDVRRWQWIGNLAEETDVFVIRADLPYRHILELRQAEPPVVVGATGPGANTYDYPLALRAFLRLNLRIVSGYPGGADINLAMERKEVDARAGSSSSMLLLADRGLVRPLVRTPSENPRLRGIPVDQDLVSEPAERAGFEISYRPGEVCLRTVQEVLATPPGVVRIFKELFRFGE